ncbi:MAG: hypothetical protein GKR87_08630 [Kiritimatiellae bacterium]|nr:hypothetical protein [Kiritimatiellia bacterium]
MESSGNVVGGSNTVDRNFIGGNIGFGVYMLESNAFNNAVIGNYIGTGISEAKGFGHSFGIRIVSSANNNQIGGPNVAEGNLIVGSTSVGVAITSSSSNRVTGNRIGRSLAGNTIPNQVGVFIEGSSSNNTVGGTN